MVYGELMINKKHDYTATDIFQKWFAFGVVIKASRTEDNDKIAADLRVAGYSSIVKEDLVVVTPNDQLFKMFMKLRIPTVSYYKPRSILDAKWATGTLVPTFTSLHNYITSEWCA